MLRTPVVFIEGDGIGPEVMRVAEDIVDWFGGFKIIKTPAGESACDRFGVALPDETIKLIEEHKICIKGPLTTPVGGGYKSATVALRQHFNLFSNIRPVKSVPGVSPFPGVDIIVFRENTEGAYACVNERTIETEKGLVASSEIIVSEENSRKFIRHAFDWSVQHKRKKITIIHKANILKQTTGLFRRLALEIGSDYPQIELDECIIDAACMKMVCHPRSFDVLITTNLFGDIISDLASGLVGGLGLVHGANVGKDIIILEAVHGTAPDIAGKNQANPISVVKCVVDLLRHVGRDVDADLLDQVIESVLRDRITADLGGSGSTIDVRCKLLELLDGSRSEAPA